MPKSTSPLTRVNGTTLKVLREARGLSTEQLAQRAGVKNRSHISNIENENRQASVELILRLADALVVPPIALIGPPDSAEVEKVLADARTAS